MAKYSRVQNDALREAIYYLIPKILDGTPLFASTFGHKFAKKSLQKNVLNVYSNEPMELSDAAGYYRCSDKSITFTCKLSDIEKLLTPKDIMDDKNLLHTALHESLHAALNRSKEELEEYNLVSGTGVLEQSIEGPEIGRGINEGYVEWFCEKCGLSSKSYPELKKFVKLIETAIGTKNTAALGKGGIKKNFPRLLDMTIPQTLYMLALSDETYKTCYDFNRYDTIRDILRRKQNLRLFDESTRTEIEEVYKIKLPMISSDMSSKGFLDYIQQQGLEASEESYFKYLNESKVPDLEKRKYSSIIDFESMVLEHYFKKDFESVIGNDESSIANIHKMISIYTCLNYVPEAYSKTHPNSFSVQFKEKVENALSKYSVLLGKEQASAYLEGKLNIKDFLATSKMLDDLKFNLRHEFLKSFIDGAFADKPEKFREDMVSRFSGMLNDLQYKDSTDSINRLLGSTIIRATSNDPTKEVETSLVIYNGGFLDQLGESNYKSVSKDDGDDVLDFTMVTEEGYRNVINSFCKLREDVYKKNKDAQIFIASQNIIIKDGDDIQVYNIYEGQELVPLHLEDSINLQFVGEVEPKKEENTGLVPYKNNFVSRIFNGIRRGFNKLTNRNMPENVIYAEKGPVNDRIVFDAPVLKPVGLKEKYKVTDLTRTDTQEQTKPNETKVTEDKTHVD